MKNTCDQLRRLDTAEEGVLELDYLNRDLPKWKAKRAKSGKTLYSLQDLWDNYEKCNRWWKSQRRRKRERNRRNMRNSDYENFQKSKSDIKPQIPEAQRTSSRTNDQKITPKNIIFKLQKIKGDESSQRKKPPDLENKDNNCIWLLRSRASKKRVEWDILNVVRNKSPT